MKASTHTLLTTCVCLVVAVFGRPGLAADPVIHAQWDGGGNPVPDLDYVINTSAPASPEFPDVELRTGHLDWRIWSTDTDNPGGVGDIGVISSPASENFAVNITNPSHPFGHGARDVKAIRLVPTNTGNYSNIANGFIVGRLIDELIVQDASGTGGEVSIWIANVVADMTIPKANFLDFSGSVSGTVTIGELAGDLHMGSFSGTVNIGTVTGYVSAIRVFQGFTGSLTVTEIQDDFVLFNPCAIEQTGFLSFGDILSPALMEIGQPGGGQLAGTLQFLSGINNSIISVDAELTGVIDLNDVGVAAGGQLSVSRGNGNISNGGVVSGSVNLGTDASFPFSGNANFADADAGAIIDLIGPGALDFSGTFDGEVCGTNLSPSAPDAANLPPNITIAAFGVNASICGGCGVLVDAVIDEPSPMIAKNRYLSMENENIGLTAIRIRPVSLDGYPLPDPPDRWVSAPFEAPEENTDFPGLTFMAATVQCEPHFRDWSTVGLMHVVGAEIVPGSSYEVQVVADSCAEALTFVSSYSQPLALGTGKWGDIVDPLHDPDVT